MARVLSQKLVLDEYLTSSTAVIQADPFPPEPYPPGSLADIDISHSDNEAVLTLVGGCVILQESAADHAWAIARGLIEPTLVFSLFTCCRAILECCSTALWILDSSADPLERIRRSIVVRAKNVDEQRKLAERSGDSERESKAKARLTEIVQRAASLGISVSSGEIPRIEGSTLSATELAKAVFDAESIFRILSGVAHGHRSYLNQLGMRRDEQFPNILVKELSPEAVDLVTRYPLIWLSRLTFELRSYCGNSPGSFEQVCQTAYRRLHVPKEEWFWAR